MTGSALDLNKLRETVLRNRAEGKEAPTEPDRKIYVHQGKIVDRPEGYPEHELSEIHQGTFA
jgi:hypothetical protein